MKHFFLFLLFLLLIGGNIYAQGTPCPGTPTVTYSGKTYNTVQIGSQCWLKENLDVGVMINGTDTMKNNGFIEKYCYNNDPANCATYGGLYQWNEAMQYVTADGSQGICPSDWHIPKFAEFELLSNYVNNDGNTLKAIGQGTGSGSGTNISGFSALLSGRRFSNGVFDRMGELGYFLTSTLRVNDPYHLTLYTDESGIGFYDDNKVYGFSVRCVRDETTGNIDRSNKNHLPNSIKLFQNYPNPFNPRTTISFNLPERTKLALSIFNELGQKVAELFNGEKVAGSHSIEWDASKFGSGVYFYELKTEKYSVTKRLILLK